MVWHILRRVGVVLLLGGVVDVMLLADHVAMPLGHQAGWWLPGMLAGVFLVLGSLRTAAIVRQVGGFCAAATATGIVTLPLTQPVGLMAARIRQDPFPVGGGIATWMIALVALAWIVDQLNHEDVRSAMTAAGMRRRGLGIAMSTGCAVTLVIVGLTMRFTNSAAAAHARMIAESHAGPTYSYFVRFLMVNWSGGIQHGRAVVYGWNDRELMQVTVEWPERNPNWRFSGPHDPAVCQWLSPPCASSK